MEGVRDETIPTVHGTRIAYYALDAHKLLTCIRGTRRPLTSPTHSPNHTPVVTPLSFCLSFLPPLLLHAPVCLTISRQALS